MFVFILIFSALPYFCLPLAILLCSTYAKDPGAPFFNHVITGALFWSAYIWLTTNLFSLDNRIDSVNIHMAWLTYALPLAAALWRRRKLIKLPNPFPLPRFESILAICIGIAIATTLFCAVAYPPSNWDALSYHLPRIEQWLQNHTLAPFPTCIPRQIGMPPFNSMIALQSLAMGHCDIFVNLGQWFAYVGCIAGVFAITLQIGGTRRAAWLSAFFLASLPSAITQASNTESSEIATFWLLCCASLFLKWHESRNWRLMALFGACLGFAILSKGSAYPLGLPFVLLIAWLCLRYPKKLLAQGFLAAILIIAINLPHLARVHAAYGTPVGGTETNILFKPTPGTFIVNSIYNFLVHEPWLIKSENKKEFWIDVASAFNVDQNDTAVFPWGGIRRAADYSTPSDSYGQNPFQAIFLFLVFGGLLFRKFQAPHIYLAAALGAFATYFLLLTWHPWTGRIHTSLFAFAAPLCGLCLDSWRRPILRCAACAIFCWGALTPLFNYLGKPPMLKPDTTQATAREKAYFVNWDKITDQYIDAVNYLAAQKPDCIGLDLADNAFEYPIWILLSRRVEPMPRLSPMRPDKNGEMPKPDYIFVQEEGAGDQPLGAIRVLRKGASGYIPVFPD